MKPPETLEAGLRQLCQEGERWVRRCRTVIKAVPPSQEPQATGDLIQATEHTRQVCQSIEQAVQDVIARLQFITE